ncbi:hypothetical protein NP493_199g06054 [Ridgeia piscesae]|uniref:C2H2-type domain-containing protein n=1 Tax=Ridgeia piscesae TaxID=27915 RepID=A0AAD9P1M4_RIDPI|nr:hypothetical protein NP493_199g06054 [Ridgeia piscesae]
MIDTFICGSCQLAFHDIAEFLQHKNACCEETTPQQQQQIQAVLGEDGSISAVLVQSEGEGQPQNALPLEEVQGFSKETTVGAPSEVSVSGGEVLQPLQQQYKTSAGVAEASTDGNVYAVVNSSNQGDVLTWANAKIQLILSTPNSDQPKTAVTKIGGRKRGRPKKGEEKAHTAPVNIAKVEKPALPERAADGLIHCPCCKKVFRRERHFTTHKCLASSDYVDITKKELMNTDELDSDGEAEEATDADNTADFHLYSQRKNVTGTVKCEAETTGKDPAIAIEATDIGDLKGTVEPTGTQPGTATGTHEQIGNTTVTNLECNVQPQDSQSGVDSGANVKADLSLGSKGRARLPVFVEEEDKVAFEQNINVDLSQVDNMFRTLVIEQEVNENAPPPSSRTMNELSIYSCNVCEKVFMSLSHMRQHCLIHTDLRPFHCTKCEYATNTKGNLYTHMRKHTGQFYRCEKCSFKTTNKGHLVEHEATHTGHRHKCDLCHKDYNTVKSLQNHIRKYHAHTRAGRDYLAQFQLKQNKCTAVLHQCHICNRKFKKKVDCDRHLFVHNIKDNPNVYACELCNYAASRRMYLDKHFRRHRVVYFCCHCEQRFASTIRLTQHLNEVHLSDSEVVSEEEWEELFWKCIQASLYLPEPGGTVGEWDQDEASDQVDVSESAENWAGDTLGGDTPGGDTQHSDIPGGVDSEMTTCLQSQQTDISKSDETKDGLLVGNMEDAVSTSIGDCPNADSTNGVVKKASHKAANGESCKKDSKLESINSFTDIVDKNTDTVTDDSVLPDTDMTPQPDVVVGDAAASMNDIFERLGFCSMNMQVFQELRQMFGNEECEYCGRLFYSKSDHEAHIRTHTGDKPYACDQCNYRAITKENLKRHIEKEHAMMHYVCSQCSFEASNRTQLWVHQQKHKLESVTTCQICQAKFESNKRLKIHLQMKHKEISAVDMRKMLAPQRKSHGKIGRKTHKCPYCSRTFLRANSDLQKHIWIHEGVKPFKCSLCPHACRSKNNLAAHMLRHSSEKPFLCTECGKAYKSKTALRWHIRSHKDGKIFKCTKCSYEALQKSHLKRHMETHDIVKRFVCEHCDYSANTIGYLKIHYTCHHKGSQYLQNPNPPVVKQMNADTKVYRCLSCDYLFGNLSDMKRHLKIRHHIHMQDLQALEKLGGLSQVTQIMPADGDSGQASNTEEFGLQVVHMETLPPSGEETSSSAEMLQYSGPQPDMDEKTVSAVNLLQQIIDMSQQGAFGSDQPITVQSEDGQRMVVVKPETILIQHYIDDTGQQVVTTDVNQQDTLTQDGPHVMVTDDSQVIMTQDGQQVISTQDEQQVIMTQDGQQVITTQDGQQVITTQDDQQVITEQDDQQVIMTEDGQQVIMTQDGQQVIMTQDGQQIITTSPQQCQEIINISDTSVADSIVNVTYADSQHIVTTMCEEVSVVGQEVLTSDSQQVISMTTTADDIEMLPLDSH